MPDSNARPEEGSVLVERALERTTGFEPATPPWQWHGGCLMRLHPSHQCPELRVLRALVSSASPDCWGRPQSRWDLVGAFPPRPPIPRRKSITQRDGVVAEAYPLREAPILPPFGAPHGASMVGIG